MRGARCRRRTGRERVQLQYPGRRQIAVGMRPDHDDLVALREVRLGGRLPGRSEHRRGVALHIPRRTVLPVDRPGVSGEGCDGAAHQHLTLLRAAILVPAVAVAVSVAVSATTAVTWPTGHPR